MKKQITILSFLTAMILCTGCASIVSKSQWPVTINSQPSGASVTIKKENGDTVQKGVTPMTVTLASDKGYFSRAKYVCSFEKEGYDAATIDLAARINGWYFGNIVFGGLIGLVIVDPATGAMWKLDDSVSKQLAPHAIGNSNDPNNMPTAIQVKSSADSGIMSNEEQKSDEKPVVKKL